MTFNHKTTLQLDLLLWSKPFVVHTSCSLFWFQKSFYDCQSYLRVYLSTKSSWTGFKNQILKRPQKFETISHLIWQLLNKRQIMWEIVSNFVAFLENLNFNAKCNLLLWSKLTIGHGRFLNTNLLLIKTFLFTKFDCILFPKLCWSTKVHVF